MGSGISLSKDQVIYIIKRDLRSDFLIRENMKPKFTEDGVEIYYDFSDEANLIKDITEIDMFRRKEFRLGYK
jgi:hypothetical protein